MNMANTAIDRKYVLLKELDRIADLGQLRRISAAFARFMVALGMQDPALILACAILSELEGRGHSCLLLADLHTDPGALLGLPPLQWQNLAASAGVLPNDLAGWHASLQQCAQVWSPDQPDRQQPLVLEPDRLYLRRYWRDENSVAGTVLRLAQTARNVDAAQVRLWLDKLFVPKVPVNSSVDWQKMACAVAIRSQLSIITGGPGTGKTYTVARLLALLFALSDKPDRLRIALAAPTGKAAARLKQSIDDALNELSAKLAGDLPLAQLTARMGAARTLHSLLGARGDTRAFKHHAGNPLELDVLIVDEASMVHLEMMASLLQALPPNAMIIFLGDKDQLASVEAGSVLGDMCLNAQAGGYTEPTLAYVQATTGITIPADFAGTAGALSQQTVMLRESRRFTGPIAVLAEAVNLGRVAEASDVLRTQSANGNGVLSWQEHAQPQALLQLAEGSTESGGGYQPYLRSLSHCPATEDVVVYEKWVAATIRHFETFRFLCAVREGEWGVTGINAALEQRFDALGLIRRNGEWYAGRPVMVTRNDYGMGVFNGDIGICLPDPLQRTSMRVYFMEGQSIRSVLATRLQNVETAYAMTVHKSQGSEFHHVVVVLPPDGASVVTRELIYTGITRSRELFTLVTPVAAVFERAVQTQVQRASGLGKTLHGTG